MQQTYKHLEIVVVGDGCTDDTVQRIADLGDPRIHFVNLPQCGRYPDGPSRRWMVAGTVPMNHALSLCRGDFITHLDDDDEHDRTRVEKLVAFARENNRDFVWNPFHYECAPGEWELHPCGELRLTQVTTSSIFYRRWLARIGWDINAHLLAEPGDWNRLRKFLYLGIKAQRYPEPLLRHYREQTQNPAAA
jgi:glycosyltransferase involved in cell wall biosynthesis